MSLHLKEVICIVESWFRFTAEITYPLCLKTKLPRKVQEKKEAVDLICLEDYALYFSHLYFALGFCMTSIF